MIYNGSAISYDKVSTQEEPEEAIPLGTTHATPKYIFLYVLVSSITFFLLGIWMKPLITEQIQPSATCTPTLDYTSLLTHINRGSVCSARHWDDLITIILDVKATTDCDSNNSSDSLIELTRKHSPNSGQRRLYHTLLKVLCGHPIEIGVSGTSVSAGHGVDFDVNRVYVHHVWQWFNQLPLLPQALPLYHTHKLKHGYRNTAVAGVGSDLAGLCLNTFWSNTIGIFNKYIASDVDPTPDVFGLTSRQLAAETKRGSILPDLLFVEYLANDFNFIELKGSWYFAWIDKNQSLSNSTMQDDIDFSDPVANMERLIDGVFDHSATTPILLNTIIVNNGVIRTIEDIYNPVSSKYDIPVISYYNRFGVFDGHHHITTDAEQSAIAGFVRTKLLVDSDHLNDAGHMDLALYIIERLRLEIHRITYVINSYTNNRVDTPDHALQNQTTQLLLTSETYCAISFSYAQLQVATFQNPLVHQNFYFVIEKGNKGQWLSWKAGAELAFDCFAIIPQTTTQQSLMYSSDIKQVSFSYLSSWNATFGKAMVWIASNVSFVITHASNTTFIPFSTVGVMLNTSTPRIYNSHWELPQTTAVVKTLQLRSHRNLLDNAMTMWRHSMYMEVVVCISSPSCHVQLFFHTTTLHVVNLIQDMRFSFVGLYVQAVRK